MAQEDLLGSFFVRKVEQNGAEHVIRFQVSSYREQVTGNRKQALGTCYLWSPSSFNLLRREVSILLTSVTKAKAVEASAWVIYFSRTASMRNVSVSIREPFATDRKLA
jgi:hypothetical protein